MKHLRRFDEELDPTTYRRAGQRLIGKFKEERGGKLIDYGNEQEFGFYNMYFCNNNGKIGSPIKVTNPKAKFYFGSYEQNSFDGEGNISIKHKSAEELVSAWKKGDELAFTISFSFMATEESKRQNDHNILKDYRGVPMFSFRVSLSDWLDGLDEWNTDQETNELITGPEAHDIYDMFENSFHNVMITLERPVHKYQFGVFTDRASAFKFKKELPKLIEPFEGHIHDIISVIGGESEQIEKIMELFKKITLNGLYDDDTKAKVRNNDFSYRWFSDNIIAQ
jgi:hypothetical protein